MRTINRLSWLLLGIGITSLGVAAALVVVAGVLLHVSLSFLTVWAALAIAIGFKVMADTGEASGPPPTPPPPSRPEPETPLEDLERLRQMWLRGDIPEAVYRQAVEQRTRRYRPPPPPAQPRRRRWP